MSRSSTIPRALALVAVAACGGGDRSEAPRVTRETVGDTTVVRTESGSAWGATRMLVPTVAIGVLEGEDAYMFGSVRAIAVAPDERIFVLDAQVPAVRLYSADGGHLRDVGRPGEGPGEYQEPDGGLTYMPDGRVALRDPGTGKIVIFSSRPKSFGARLNAKKLLADHNAVNDPIQPASKNRQPTSCICVYADQQARVGPAVNHSVVHNVSDVCSEKFPTA